jgi:prophage DNA circulation protein
MSTSAQFDASLPTPYKENWREAYRTDPAENPRVASYQSPGGEAIPFIQKGFRFSGGQSKDTAEYPFGGLWSNEYLNEKPQSLTVDGYLRGPAYIAQRNKLIEALRVPTDDDNPGYIDLPFWGRFPVVVNDNYEISETADEQGQCSVSISFTRAGVSITDRLDALPPASAIQLENEAVNLQAVAVDDFEKKLSEPKPKATTPPQVFDERTGVVPSEPEPEATAPPQATASPIPPIGLPSANNRLDIAALTAGFEKIETTLLSALGRIQGAQTVLNGVTNEVLGITDIISRGTGVPREYAQALFNAGMSIASGILNIKNSIALYGQKDNRASGTGVSASSSPSLPPPNNERNLLIQFLSADTYVLSEEKAVTVSQEATIAAGENIYRIMAFLVSARLIENTDSLTRNRAEGYWRLFERLKESINRENSAVYASMQNIHTALSRELSRREISREMTRHISVAAPLLFLAYYLGCDEDKIRELNSVADSFVIEGNVIYV